MTLNTGTQRRPRAGRADGDRPRGGLVDLRAGRRAARHARRRRRAAPLRLERLLVRAVPVGAAPARRAPLPAGPGPALLEHPRRRHQGRREGAEARQDDRRPRRSPPRPATRARTPSTAGPTGSTSPRSATPRATGRAASSCSTTTTSRSRAPWEADRGPQELAYDFWWHLNYGTVITSEWGTPNMVEDGLHRRAAAGQPVRPQAARVGPQHAHATCRRSTSAPEHQMVLELRPAHDPSQGLRVRRRRHLDGRPDRPRCGCGSAPTTAR